MPFGRRLLVTSTVLAAAASATPAVAHAVGSAVPGWRVVASIDRPKYNSLLSVAATSTRSAWAGGCWQRTPNKPGPAPVPVYPMAEHFSRHVWRRSVLPAGLSGCITEVGASSARNVWAFGNSVSRHFQVSVFALRRRSGRWSVAHTWGPRITLDNGFVGAAVVSRTSVWVFLGSDVVEHFDGTAWHRMSIPGLGLPRSLSSVSVDSRGGVWVLANGNTGIDSVARPKLTAKGYAWQVTPVFGLLPPGGGFTSIYARTPGDVWLVGGGQRQVHGRTVFFPVAAHFASGAWHAVSVTGSFALRAAVTDGHGGLWVTTDWDATGVPPHLLHYTGGRFIPVRLARHGSRYVGVFGLARIPGTTSVWGAATLSGLGGLGAPGGLVLKDGR
jgi:hypothetical protein